MFENTVADLSIVNHNEPSLKEKRERLELLRDKFATLRAGHQPEEGLPIVITVVDTNLERTTSKLGVTYDAVVLTYEEELKFSLAVRRRTKHSGTWTDEAALLMSLNIGDTYKVTRSVNDEGFLQWVSAELVDAAAEDPAA